MPPYAKAIQEAVQLPVFDIFTLTDMVYNSLVKKEIADYIKIKNSPNDNLKLTRSAPFRFYFD